MGLSVWPTHYEGPKPLFYAVKYNGTVYTVSDKDKAGYLVLDTSLKFDPDDPETGMGDLSGEETSMFIPEKPPDTLLSDIPREFTNGLSLMKNPIQTYEWNITNPDGSITIFHMEEWVPKYFVSITYEWNSPDERGGMVCPPQTLTPYAWDRRYNNVEVWIKIDLEPTWYFEEQPTRVYFGIAKIVVNNVKRYIKDPYREDID